MDDITKSLEKIEKGLDKVTSLEGQIASMNKEIADMKVLSLNATEPKEKSLNTMKTKFWNSVVKKSINEYTVGEGGYLIPEEYSNEILNYNYAYGKIRPNAQIIPMTSDTMNITSMAQVTAGYVSGSAAIGESNISLTPYVLSLKNIGTILRYDNNFLADITTQKVAMIDANAMEAFGAWEDNAILQGSGALDATNGGITGILNTAGVTVVTSSASAFSGITVADLSAMIDAPSGAIKNGTFIFDRTIRQYIRKLQDGASQFVWSPAVNGDVERVYGYPVIFVNGSLPIASATATGKAYGIFGDLKGVLIGDRGTVEVATSTDSGFTTNQTLVRYLRRLDAKIVPNQFAILKTANS